MNVAIWVAVIGGLFSVGAIIVSKWYESRSTNIAVLAEVQRLLNILDDHKKWWQHCVDHGDTGYPLLPFTTPIFDLQAKNIGQIDSTLVAKIVRFYGYLKFVNALQAERGKYEKSGKASEFDKQYLRVLDRMWSDFNAVFDNEFRARGLLQSG